MSESYLKYSYDEFISKFKLFNDIESIIKEYSDNNPDIVSDFDLNYELTRLFYDKFTLVSSEINSEIDYANYVNCMNMAFQSKGRMESISWMLLANNIQLKSIYRCYPVTDGNVYYYKDGGTYSELPRDSSNNYYFSDHMEIYSNTSGSESSKVKDPYFTLYRSKADLQTKLPWIIIEALELKSVEIQRLNDAIKECAPYLIWDKYGDLMTTIENITIDIDFSFNNTEVDRAYGTVVAFAVKE